MLEYDPDKKFSYNEKFTVQFYLERLVNVATGANPDVKQHFTETCSVLSQFIEAKATKDAMAAEEILNLSRLPLKLTLQALSHLVVNSQPCQDSLAKPSLDIIYTISKRSFDNKDLRPLSLLAEEVVKALNTTREPGEAAEYVKAIVKKERDDKKKAAMRRKQAVLRKMKKSKKKTQALEVREETGLRCGVCYEGYSGKPKDLLGVYVFVRKTKMSKGVHLSAAQGYTTVTRFTVIHLSCHQQAYLSDQQNNRKRTSEWENNQLNLHSKCNGLFPIKGGDLTAEEFRRCVNEYFNKLQAELPISHANLARVTINDLRCLIKRLAWEEPVSLHYHGGEHNMKIVPFMIHATLILGQGSGSESEDYSPLSAMIPHLESYITSTVERIASAEG